MAHKPITKSWVVSIETKKPYDLVILDVFAKEADALCYAEAYAEGRVAYKQSKRVWRLPSDDDVNVFLIVRERWNI